MASKIIKDDEVIVLTGKDRGKVGKVLLVNPKRNTLVVSGVNKFKRHRKKTDKMEGGIIETEGQINRSNVALVCPKKKVKTRIGFKQLENGKKTRLSKLSGETI